MAERLPQLAAVLAETRAVRSSPRRGRHRAPARHRTSACLAALGALLVLTSAPPVVRGLAAATPPERVPVSAPLQRDDGPAAAPAISAALVSAPTRVVVPAVGIDAEVIPLGVDDGGDMRVPSDPDVAAWFQDGPLPGQTGVALLVGHVDSTVGPAVFHPLRQLRPGDVVQVLDAQGSMVDFVVDQVSVHAKDDFPTRLVFAPTGGSELRLVTCSGAFDRRTREYRDNLVVHARQVADQHV